MPCRHEGFHSCTARYDRAHGQLAYLVVCDRCGATLQELRREAYRPRFDPHGWERFSAAVRAGA